MRKQTKVLLVASALFPSLAAAPALLAHDSRDHGLERDGLVGNGGMMRMMEHCSRMMGDGARQPNDQWRKPRSGTEK